MEFTFTMYGHEYTVWTDDDGKILETACRGRWGRTNVASGDEWLDNQLQSRVDEIIRCADDRDSENRANSYF